MTVLATLAQQASAQPQPPGNGPYEYLHLHTWTLGTKSGTTGVVFDTRVVESDRELWFCDDGLDWYEEIRDGQRARWSGKQFKTAGRLPVVAGTDVDAIKSQLSSRQSGGGGADWISFIAETWSRQTVTPAVQAAMLQVLSNAPDLIIEGTVTDRAGRDGIAVSAMESHNDNAVYCHILILDPATSAVLAAEKIALQALGKPIKVPTTVSYTLWISTGYVAAPRERL